MCFCSWAASSTGGYHVDLGRVNEVEGRGGNEYQVGGGSTLGSELSRGSGLDAWVARWLWRPTLYVYVYCQTAKVQYLGTYQRVIESIDQHEYGLESRFDSF